MLSGEFTSVPIDSINWKRAGRIRRVITEDAITEKMESMARLGLIHPITITREHDGIAGETRWTAAKRLGWTAISIQWSDTLDERELLKIEYEENYKRTDLPWQDQCDFLRRFHQMSLEENPAWRQEDTAEAMGLDQATVSKQLSVAEAIAAGDERVIAIKEYSTAVGVVKRQKERKAADELSMLKIGSEDDDGDDGTEGSGEPGAQSPIITANFLEWVKTYDGPSFNLISCDFPYGINADKFNQGSAEAYGGYEDTPETYWSLVAGLVDNKEKLLGTSGHIIFWFSMRWYTETLETLRKHFWVDPYPLVWHKSDNKGTLPDPERGPRRIYEVAFLCSHGDRKIIQSVSNTFSGPTVKLGEHMSEKSEDMQAHFMRMMVDENTRLLDPTCGSGSSLRAAARLGAGSVLGLEQNPEFAELARRAFDAQVAG